MACGLSLIGASAKRRAAATPGSAQSSLTPSDRRIAELGARLARSDPAAAGRLVRSVDTELPGWLRLTGARRRARVVRQRLLAPARVAADLDRGEVMSIDGWLLARSEVAAAAYLHGLRQREPRLA